MSEPFDYRQLEYIEFEGVDELTVAFRALEKVHAKARTAVSQTNQKRSEYETSLESQKVHQGGQSQIDYIRSSKRMAFASSCLNQWFLRKPYWKAVKKLLEVLQYFKAHHGNGAQKSGWAWTIASQNNIVCAEQLIKDALKTLARFTDFPEEDGRFMEETLKDCQSVSWLPQMPFLKPVLPEDIGLYLPGKAELYLRCMEAITSASWSEHVKYVAVVDVAEIPSPAIRELASYFETLNFSVEYDGGVELLIRKKPI